MFSKISYFYNTVLIHCSSSSSLPHNLLNDTPQRSHGGRAEGKTRTHLLITL